MTREALLVQTLVELADNLVDDFDVIDVLTCSATGASSPRRGLGRVMLAAPVVSSRCRLVERRHGGLELFELQADEGPCVDCFVSVSRS